MNGLNLLDFDGSNDQLDVPLLGLTETNGAIMFAVFELDNDGTYTVVGSTTDPSTSGIDRFSPNQGSYPSLFVDDRLENIATGIMPSDGAHLYSKSVLLASDSYQYHVDGSLTPNVDASTGSRNFDGSQIYIGGVANGYMDGAIGEVIFLNERPDEGTRQKIEGYLAHKWGLTANLPSEHPYKTGAPVL
jgi:hypothetical protein